MPFLYKRILLMNGKKKTLFNLTNILKYLKYINKYTKKNHYLLIIIHTLQKYIIISSSFSQDQHIYLKSMFLS